MAKKNELVEIKKNGVGYGLLIENDGYMKMPKDKIKESLGDGGEWNVPYPFVVDAVFQKYGIKNANGRVYPENVLKKQVELYQQKKVRNVRNLKVCQVGDSPKTSCSRGAGHTTRQPILSQTTHITQSILSQVTNIIMYARKRYQIKNNRGKSFISRKNVVTLQP